MKKTYKKWLKTIKEQKTLQLQFILLFIFTFLLSFSYIAEQINKGTKDLPILKINPLSFGRLLFTPTNKKPFSLEKITEETWSLVAEDLRYPSSDSDIQSFLISLTNLKGIEIQNQDRKLFNLSTIPFLTFYNKEEIEKEAIFLGDRNTLKREIYIQRKSDNKIFLIPDIFLSLVNQGLIALTDNRLFPNIKNQELILMETIPLVTGANELPVESKLTYKRTLTGWKSSWGIVPSSASFDSLNLLKATEVLSRIPLDLSKEPHFEITLLWANNSQAKITIFKGIDERLLASVQGNPYAYLLDPASLLQFYEKPPSKGVPTERTEEKEN